MSEIITITSNNHGLHVGDSVRIDIYGFWCRARASLARRKKWKVIEVNATSFSIELVYVESIWTGIGQWFKKQFKPNHN